MTITWLNTLIDEDLADELDVDTFLDGQRAIWIGDGQEPYAGIRWRSYIWRNGKWEEEKVRSCNPPA